MTPALMLFVLVVTAPPRASSVDSVDPEDGVVSGRIEYVRTEKNSRTESSSLAIVSGKWRMPGGGKNGTSRVGCGDGRVGMHDPLSFSGLTGTMASEEKWAELGPFMTKAEMNDEQIEYAQRTAVRTLQTSSIPFHVSVDDNNRSRAIDENLAMLGCLYLDAKNQRFVFDKAMASTRGGMVPASALVRTAWNQFGGAVAPGPVDLLESVDTGVRFSGKYDPKSSVLSGTWRDAEVDQHDALTHGQDSHSHTEFLVSYRFVLREEKLELEVIPASYETWIPRAGIDEKTAGNALTVVARLVDADGKPTGVKARSITFELSDVSQEPGVTLNWPVGARGQEPDMKFEPSLNPELRVTGSKLDQATNPIDGVTKATAVIASFDQGAWATLKVRAELFDGKKIEGYLTGEKGKKEIPIPFRKGDSKIAEEWKKGHGKFAESDGWDDEALPALDGKRGDGLSAYEEYRGLRVRGGFGRLSPKVKDLVVVNEIGALAQPGLQLFEKASGITLTTLDKEQLPKSRIVNANARTAHKADQHGLLLRSEGLPDGKLGEVRPNLGGLITSPKTCDEVVFDPKAFTVSPHAAVDIAHELAHGLGANHHGDLESRKSVDFIQTDHYWLYDLNGVHLQARWPDGGVVKPGAIDKAWELNPPIAEVGGQLSGDVGCIMVYTKLYAVVRHGGKDHYLLPKLADPTHFCQSKAGTGINDATLTKLGGQPFSYMGNAGDPSANMPDANPKLKRGNCLGQLHVRDSDARTP